MFLMWLARNSLSMALFEASEVNPTPEFKRFEYWMPSWTQTQLGAKLLGKLLLFPLRQQQQELCYYYQDNNYQGQADKRLLQKLRAERQNQ